MDACLAGRRHNGSSQAHVGQANLRSTKGEGEGEERHQSNANTRTDTHPYKRRLDHNEVGAKRDSLSSSMYV